MRFAAHRVQAAIRLANGYSGFIDSDFIESDFTDSDFTDSDFTDSGRFNTDRR